MPLDTSKYKDQKSVELPNTSGKTKPQTKSDRHAQTANVAHQSIVQDKATLLSFAQLFN